MSTVDLLVQEIRKLSSEEVKELLAKVGTVQRPPSKRKDVRRYLGIAKGLWGGDTQKYVKEGRSDML
jgi:hypothetical protein